MGFRLPPLIFLTLYPLASGACPVKFQTQSAASLKPTPTSHIVLLKQNEGSYTGYEITDAAPYTVLKTTPNFQKQLTLCPPPPGGAGPLAPPQAFAHLASGGYLFAQRSDVFNTTGAYFSVYVVQFDASLRLTSSADLTLSAGPQNPGIATTLTLADVNGDGEPDLIAGTSYPHFYGLQILLGTGGTGFQTPALYSVSNYNIESVVVADVNGDKKPDLVVAGSFGDGGAISVFLGNGDGTFQTEQVVAKILGAVSAVAIGDLNGDGQPDLAFPTNYTVPAVLVALGNGDGTFSNPVSYPSNGSGSIAIGDVNGDGFADIVASGATILFGDGTGAFPNRRDYVQQTEGNVILTDFDGDGKTDIVIGTGASWILSGTAVAVLYGHGDGTFSGAPVGAIPGFPASDNEVNIMKSANFDGDGIPDVIMSGNITGITALDGNGDGTFKVTWQHKPQTQDNIPGGFAGPIAIGDFNRDGIPDFAAEIETPSPGMLEVFLGVGDGRFQPPALIPLGSSLGDYLSMAVADFNGDGKLDLALVTTPWLTGGRGEQQHSHLAR